MIKRHLYNVLLSRLSEPRQFIQVLTGPRQVGKTTLCQQVIEACSDKQCIYISADEANEEQAEAWLVQNWTLARLKAKQQEVTLFIDEIQKIKHWSSAIKQLWDEDTRTKTPIKLVLLGSSPLLIQQGLTESLAGRFEVLHLRHWSYAEMQKGFDFSLPEYIFFGGYPGAATLTANADRWQAYIRDALIEPTITKDILLLNRVDKPALLRQLFFLGASHSAQILSFNKMLGTLQGAGNTTTLSHYLNLLTGAGLLTGLEKYAPKMLHSRGTSPKFQILNTALMSVTSNLNLEETLKDPKRWGQLVESAVGAHLYNASMGQDYECYYWHESGAEVDFVLVLHDSVLGIEVKSGLTEGKTAGMKKFQKRFPDAQIILVGGQGLPLETFFQLNPIELLNNA